MFEKILAENFPKSMKVNKLQEAQLQAEWTQNQNKDGDNLESRKKNAVTK